MQDQAGVADEPGGRCIRRPLQQRKVGSVVRRVHIEVRLGRGGEGREDVGRCNGPLESGGGHGRSSDVER